MTKWRIYVQSHNLSKMLFSAILRLLEGWAKSIQSTWFLVFSSFKQCRSTLTKWILYLNVVGLGLGLSGRIQARILPHVPKSISLYIILCSRILAVPVLLFENFPYLRIRIVLTRVPNLCPCFVVTFAKWNCKCLVLSIVSIKLLGSTSYSSKRNDIVV